MEHVICPLNISSIIHFSLVYYYISNLFLFFLSGRPIMKMLLILLSASSNDVVILALHTLQRIIRSDNMKPSWSNFLELILLKFIDCYKNHKEVSREIDSISVKIASTLPLDTSINILIPVIATGEYPTNLCAIKILTELTDKQGAQMSQQHLDNLMPYICKVWFVFVRG